ncbi:type VI secretion system tip protein TssI/VgrG [Stenotrophomonas maltophilia]
MDIPSSSLLASLASLSHRERLIQLKGPEEGLVVERFEGIESVCGDNRLQIDCLSTDAFLDLEPWLEQPLTLQLRQADGSLRQWHGLCTEAAQLGSDGGLARYRLILEPWTALLRLRRNAVIFQDLDTRAICEQIFADYPQAVFRFDVQAELPARAITTQYRETDWAFVTRLLAEAGLAWRIEQAQDDDAAHALVVFEPGAELPDAGRVRFHRADMAEASDGITAFAERQQLVPNASTVASWHSEQVTAVAAQSSADAGSLPPLEVYVQPRAGRFAQAGWADAEAQARLDALRVGQVLYSGSGSERQLGAGSTFTLAQHPQHEGQAFQLLAVQHVALNNLDQGIAELLGSPALERGAYRNSFLATGADVPLRALPQDRPTLHGPQTARVVGIADAAVTPNREHQVRIQFGWQRGSKPNPGGLTETGSAQPGHAPGDHTSGSWVSVAEWVAGPNWGTAFLPRVGSEVLVEFLHGDIDQPRITGQLYNGEVAPPFGGGIDENARHPGVLSGLHTQAHDGSGTQQWVMDDTPGQLRTRLHSSLADSRLELGYLIAHQDTARGALRGEGFELATQGWGNVHAGEGLLLSASLQERAASTVMDNASVVAQLKGAERSLEQMQQTLAQQQVPGLAEFERTKQLREQIDPQAQGRYTGEVNGQSAMKPGSDGRSPGEQPVERLGTPLLLAEAPHHVAWTTPASAVAYAGQNLQMTVQQDLHISAGETIATVSGEHVSLFAQSGPLRVIAAQGPVSLQAHDGELELLSDQALTITATDDRIDVLAQSKVVLQAGSSAITLEGGNITFSCPGEFKVKAGEHPFMGGSSTPASLPPLPAFTIKPDPGRTFESTFAYDQLRSIAAQSTPVEFVMMMAPTFGFDVPARTYMKLQDALKDGSLQAPEHKVMAGAPYPADYDNSKRIIRVNSMAADRAATTIEASRELLAVLLHEFGHHVDNVLRSDLAEKDANGKPTLAADSGKEEGTALAYRLAFFDLEGTHETEYAQYTSPEYNGALKVNYAEVQAALKQQGPVAQETNKSEDGRYEGFSAGDGQNHDKRPNESFGHRSIETVLVRADFEPTERASIYFGNWLRDYSQLLDPKIVRPPNLPKNLGKHLSRDALTKIVDILAGSEFHSLRFNNKAEYEVTPLRLGVYRPSEHIDNPKNIKPEPADPKSIDKDFEPWVTPGSALLQIDPKTSMKRYIMRSIDFMSSELKVALSMGKTPDGMRHFGSALHVLEDYFAHSNFCELSLRKLGHSTVLPWTSTANCTHQYPVVTGMFGSTDVIASLAEPIAHKLFGVESWEFKASKPGERSDGEKIMLVLLSEHSDQRYHKAFQDFLKLRDRIARIPGHEYLERAGWIASAPMRAVLNCYNFVYQQLLLLVGNSVDDAQTMFDSDPNKSGSTDPSHSQLAKDHDIHPLHTLAAQLAQQAVLQVGQAMAASWKGNTARDPVKIAQSYLVHPNDTNWQDSIVTNWARGHAAAIRRASSATELEHLHEEHGKHALENIRRIGRYGSDSWDYITRFYEDLFGETNQVKSK